MLVRRLSLLLLLTACCVTPDSRGVHATRPLFDLASVQPSGDEGRPAILSPSGPRPTCLSPYAAWRYRLKSVLEEPNSRISQELDLGPVPLPDPTPSTVAHSSKFDPYQTIVPLRC